MVTTAVPTTAPVPPSSDALYKAPKVAGFDEVRFYDFSPRRIVRYCSVRR